MDNHIKALIYKYHPKLLNLLQMMFFAEVFFITAYHIKTHALTGTSEPPLSTKMDVNWVIRLWILRHESKILISEEKGVTVNRW